ncbi:23S rRNA (guanosine(2251)-2'-O)-methyltransferase RlmB [Alphaproteobacteria bacterium]|nr:23S rRNA (guanosine(2251)-2'-O)-methyltransferase RlmB [Alphaproteobacteria bacterium]
MVTKNKNKRWRDARTNKGRNVDRDHYSNPVFKNLEQPSILWGRHAVIAALHNPKRMLSRVFCSKNNRTLLNEEISKIRINDPSSIPELEVLTIQELNLLVPSDSLHQGFVIISEALQEPDFDWFLEKNRATTHLTLVLLDQVTDPQNVGAIARSSAALGAHGMILQSRNAPKLDGTLAKAASGATEYIPIFRVTNIARAIRKMQDFDISCFGLAGESDVSIHNTSLTTRLALVLGAEGAGLRRLTRESCDQLVSLPTVNHFSTLNVSNAASIALYELQRRKDV